MDSSSLAFVAFLFGGSRTNGDAAQEQGWPSLPHFSQAVSTGVVFGADMQQDMHPLDNSTKPQCGAVCVPVDRRG